MIADFCVYNYIIVKKKEKKPASNLKADHAKVSMTVLMPYGCVHI